MATASRACSPPDSLTCINRPISSLVKTITVTRCKLPYVAESHFNSLTRDVCKAHKALLRHVMSPVHSDVSCLPTS